MRSRLPCAQSPSIIARARSTDARAHSGNRRSRPLAFVNATILVLALSGGVAHAQTYQVLHSFTGNDGHGFNGDTDGANPAGPLVQAPDGALLGTTVNGSASERARSARCSRSTPSAPSPSHTTSWRL